MTFNLEVFKVALQSLWTNRTRSFLTMLGVIIGVGAVIALVSIGNGLKIYIAEQFEALGSNLVYIYPADLSSVGSSDGAQSFPGQQAGFDDQHRQAIGKLDLPISQISAIIQASGKAEYQNNSFGVLVMGSESSYGQMANMEMKFGRFFTDSEEERAKKVAVIGSKVEDEVFPGIDSLGKKFFLAGISFEVIGVLEEQGGGGGGLSASSVDGRVIIPLSTAKSIFNQNQYGSIIVKAEDGADIEKIKTMIKEEMSQHFDEDEFSVFDQKQILNQIDDIMGVLTIALGGIAAISLLVGGIGIMNIMLVSVTERTPEIGLRKAVGAKNKDILIQFLIEAVFLSVLGGIIGIIFGFLGALAINSVLRTAVTAWSVVLAFSISALIGIAFGVAPANKAAKLDPVEALSHN